MTNPDAVPSTETETTPTDVAVKKPRWWLRLSLVFVLLAGVGFATFWIRGDPSRQLQIHRETTWFTGPLTEDGRIDYATALDAECSAGVTPENNAVPLLLAAFGPDRIFERSAIEPADVYAKLQIPRVRAIESPFVSAYDATKPNYDAEPFGYVSYIHDDPTERNSWSQEELSWINDWLQRNSAAMTLIAEASRRPRFYWPIIGWLGGNTLCERLDEAMHAFSIRARLAMRSGRFNEALADVDVIISLGKLCGQDGSIYCLDKWKDFHWEALQMMTGLLRDARTPEHVVQGIADRIAKLDPEGFELREVYLHRLSDLASLRNVVFTFGTADFNPPSLFSTPRSSPVVPLSPLALRWYHNLIDWNEFAILANQYHDRLEKAVALPLVQRRLALEDLSHTRWPTVRGSIPEAATINDLLKCDHQLLMDLWSHGHEDQWLTLAGSLVVLHRHQHGRFPQSLAELQYDLPPRFARLTAGDSPVEYRVFPGGVELSIPTITSTITLTLGPARAQKR